MNHLISLFVDCAPTALLLDIRDEGTAQLEHTLPSHVDVFYNFKDIDTGKYRLLLLITPYLYETSGTWVWDWHATPARRMPSSPA